MLTFISALCFGVWAVGAHAAEKGSIAAIVNSKAITHSMLQTRLKLLFSSSNIPDTEETRRRFSPQVLDNLIDETLQQQEAAALNVKVSDEDMQRAIADLEKRNNMPPGSFESSLKERNISKEAALEQIRARLLWQKVALKKLRARVTVSDAELREGLEQFTRKQNRREFQLSEIVLPVLDTTKRDEVKKLAQRIVSEVRGGGDFSIFARQFSISGTALLGGDTGWVPESRIEKEALPNLLQTAEGQVTDPIETPLGIKIYKLNKRFDPRDVEVVLKQFMLPSPYPSEAPDHMAVAGRILNGCNNVDEAFSGLKNALPESAAESLALLDLGRVKLSDLAPEFRNEVAQLPAGQASPVVSNANGLFLFVVCERSSATNTLPDAERVREVLNREKLDLESKRYLGQIRRAAFIEKR